MRTDAIRSDISVVPPPSIQQLRPVQAQDAPKAVKPSEPPQIPRVLLPERGSNEEQAVTAAVVERMNQLLRSIEARVQFEVNQETGMMVVRLVDSENPERVIRQIPSAEFLDMIAGLREGPGVLLNQKV